MEQKATSLPDNWCEQLLDANIEKQLQLLPQIELLARPQADAWQALLPLTQAADFALRLRAYLAVGRLGQAAAFMPLVEQLSKENITIWRLMILDTIFVLPQADKITPLVPLLANDQPFDAENYFLCGLVWFLGNQGELAIPLLSQQLLAQPTRARRIKDALLTEAFWLAANGDLVLLERYAQTDPPLARFCRFRVWPKNTQPHFGIFPNPDYLYENALQNGLTKEQFKQLFYWQRSKQAMTKSVVK